MDQIALLLAAIVGVPVLLIGYLALGESLLARASGATARAIRPWVWIAPALAFLGVFLIYPALNTVVSSFKDANGLNPVGFSNYSFVFTNADTRSSMGNNILWLIFYTGFAVLFGLVAAILADRVKYGGAVKTVMFMPMAISNVAAGVIWKFMYDYRPPGLPQTGTVNALLGTIPGVQPVAWLINGATNNGALVFVGVWIVAGFCMVILSAGLRGIPEEVLEAAKVDGASNWQAFISVTMPLLMPTVIVVATTMVINALKVFDIVYVMTNGNYNTDVIANQMYKQLFINRDLGRASAIAIVLLLAIIPVMIVNIRRYRAQTGGAR
jgi:alpha-glucoside transport system permease protein